MDHRLLPSKLYPNAANNTAKYATCQDQGGYSFYPPCQNQNVLIQAYFRKRVHVYIYAALALFLPSQKS